MLKLMGTRVSINEDQTLSVEWVGPKGGGSLFQIAAEGNARLVNQLEARELWAVLLSVKGCPFPMGHGEKVYLDSLRLVDSGEAFNEGHSIDDVPLGKLRELVVRRAGDGFNAPTDSYLRIAVDSKNS